MPRVLLVHDDVAEISAVKRVLVRAGHQPVLATTSSEAATALARDPPAVLVVGATCEGGEALRALGVARDASGIPMVVLGVTAAAPESAAQVPRPIDPAQLAERLAAALAAPPPEPLEPAAAEAPFATGHAASRASRPSRQEAADALRARAEELRRGAAGGRAAPAGDPPGRAPPPPARDPGLEAILRRAEEAERAELARKMRALRPAEPRDAEAGPAPPPERAAADDAGARDGLDLGRELDRDLERLGWPPDEARVDAGRPRGEVERAASAPPTAPVGDGPAELDLGLDLDRDLERLGWRLEEAPADAAQLRGEVDRASSARAAEALRRQGEDVRRRSGDAAWSESGEDDLGSAIASARAELEASRRRSEDEAVRRASAEAEIARLGRGPVPPAPAAEAAAAGPGPAEDSPASEPAEEAARRRVAALRGAERGRREPPTAPDPARPTPPRAARARPRRPDEDGSPPARVPPPELRSGTLADLPAPRLLALVARAAVSGRMDFDGDSSRSIYLEDGAVVGATSSDPAERIEEVALRLGLVTREQHRHVSSGAAPLATRRAALVLLEKGFLKPTELTGLARRRTEEVVFGVFGEAAARFRWTAGEVPADERTALERTTLALAVEGVRRRWLAPAVDAVLGGDGTLLCPVEDGPTAAELALTPDERRAVALADGLRTLDEIVATSPLDILSTRQALAALVLVGALAVRTFQGGRPAAAASAAIDLARVREKLDQVRRADYFTVLGVGRMCTPHEVREAFDRLRAEFDPRRFHGVREEGFEGRLEEILAVVADARDVLADERLRDEYLRGLGL